MTCEAELCPNWTGFGCVCEVLGLPVDDDPWEDEAVPCCRCWHEAE